MLPNSAAVKEANAGLAVLAPRSKIEFLAFHTATAVVTTDHTLAQCCSRSSAAAIAFAWAVRSGNVIAAPQSSSPAPVKENAVALALKLDEAFQDRLVRSSGRPLVRGAPQATHTTWPYSTSHAAIAPIRY